MDSNVTYLTPYNQSYYRSKMFVENGRDPSLSSSTRHMKYPSSYFTKISTIPHCIKTSQRSNQPSQYALNDYTVLDRISRRNIKSHISLRRNHRNERFTIPRDVLARYSINCNQALPVQKSMCARIFFRTAEKKDFNEPRSKATFRRCCFGNHRLFSRELCKGPPWCY